MIFIIGGEGFVGSAFARRCERDGTAYRVITRENWSDYEGQRCDVLINANGNSKKYLSQKRPLEDFDASVRSVRQSILQIQCELYVHLSSCDVYPDCSSPDVTAEDRVLDVALQSPYGFHKYLAELCVRHTAKKWIVARLGGFVGPGLWKNAIYDILHGGQLWLDPTSELQFLHTDQAAELILGLVKEEYFCEIFNVCGKGVICLQDVIDAAGLPTQVMPNSPRVRYEVDIRKLNSLFDVPASRATVLQFVEETVQRSCRAA